MANGHDKECQVENGVDVSGDGQLTKEVDMMRIHICMWI